MDVAVLGIKTLPAMAGADRVVERLLEHASDEQRFHVYLSRRLNTKAACRKNIHFIYVPSLAGKHLGPFSYFLLCALHFLIWGRAQVVHIHNSDFGLFCPLVRLKKGAKLIGTFHGDPYRRQKWGILARSYLKLSEMFFAECCHSLTSVTKMRRSARGLVRSVPVRYVPNGMDRDGSDPQGRGRESLGLAEGSYVLFACGRLDATKGLHLLLDAYERYDGPERLLIIGDFSHDRGYSTHIERLAASNSRVVLHKRLVEREQLLHVIRSSKVCVFPSEVEAMSMMLLEFLSCRKAVACSDIEENVEVVGESYPWLFRTGDAPDLLRALKSALAAPGASEIVDEVCERCVRSFDWKAIAKSYETLYARAARDSSMTRW